MNSDWEGVLPSSDGYGLKVMQALLRMADYADYQMLRLHHSQYHAFLQQGGRTEVFVPPAVSQAAAVSDAVQAARPVCPQGVRSVAPRKAKPRAKAARPSVLRAAAPPRRGARTPAKGRCRPTPPAPPLALPPNPQLNDTPICPQITILATSDSQPKPSTPKSLTL